MSCKPVPGQGNYVGPAVGGEGERGGAGRGGMAGGGPSKGRSSCELQTKRGDGSRGSPAAQQRARRACLARGAGGRPGRRRRGGRGARSAWGEGRSPWALAKTRVAGTHAVRGAARPGSSTRGSTPPVAGVRAPPSTPQSCCRATKLGPASRPGSARGRPGARLPRGRRWCRWEGCDGNRGRGARAWRAHAAGSRQQGGCSQ